MFLALKELTVYETRQIHKQIKTLQCNVCFYGGVTLLRVFPEEKTKPSAGLFGAQGAVRMHSLRTREASPANRDPLGRVVSLLRVA